jgi:hypothetical protein
MHTTSETGHGCLGLDRKVQLLSLVHVVDWLLPYMILVFHACILFVRMKQLSRAVALRYGLARTWMILIGCAILLN